jgi:hypothetical protein
MKTLEQTRDMWSTLTDEAIGGFVYVAFVIDAYARRIAGWLAPRTGHAGFVLDTLEETLHDRRVSKSAFTQAQSRIDGTQASRSTPRRARYAFRMRGIPRISVSKIVELAQQLSIPTSGYMLKHTHWPIRDADLFRVLMRSQATQAPMPTIFDLDHDHTDPKLVGVMMPFAAEFKGVYSAVTKAVIAAGFRCKGADDLWLHHKVVQTIVRES